MITKNTLKLAIAIALSITTLNADKIISSSKGICRIKHEQFMKTTCSKLPIIEQDQCKKDSWVKVLKCESELLIKFFKELRGAENGKK